MALQSISHRTCLVLVLLGLSVAAISGCTGSNDEGDQRPSRTSTPQTSSTESPDARTVAQNAALTAYKGMIDAWVEAAKTSNPDYMPLRRYADGEALKRIVTILHVSREDGKVARGAPVSTPKVSGARPFSAPTVVTITDCVDDRKWLYYTRSGQLWDNEPGGRHATSVVVHRTTDGWKVNSFASGAAGSC